MHQYDYIITGCGASGLMMAYRMANDTFFDDKLILLIDKERKSTNDRTWCYWEKGTGEWDDLLTKEWEEITFNSKKYSDQIPIAPYTYKMIRSAKFYEYLWKVIDAKSNFTFVEDEVLNISHKSKDASILTKKTEYHGKKVINSFLFNKAYKQQLKYPVLQQHFLGWFIETEEDVFNDSSATFMDFTVAQNRNTRFMYVLPMTPKKALVEYTLFSKNLLLEKEYEEEIEIYLKRKGIQKYKILEKEQGVIPMTSYKFWKYNSKHVIYIGTAGGWSKPSTGYTFMNTTKKTKALIEFLKTGESLRNFEKQTRFWTYDLLFLDVLSKDNHIGAHFFSSLFKKNSVRNIFQFLDEETTFAQDLRILFSSPSIRFVKALFNRIF